MSRIGRFGGVISVFGILIMGVWAGGVGGQSTLALSREGRGKRI